MSRGAPFGGPYSRGSDATPAGMAPPPRPPAPRTPWSGRFATSVSLRAIGLYLLPSVLLLGVLWEGLTGDLGRMLGLFGAWALFIAGARLTREGQKAALAYERHAVAKPPAFPRKLFGAAATGAAVSACAWLGGDGPAATAVFGLLAAALHVAAFGPDPMRSKGLDGLDGPALDAAVTKIETARRLIGETRDAATGFHDPRLTSRVLEMTSAAESVVARLERSPGEIGRARRFLAVYLVGARDATVAFAQAASEEGDGDAARRYGALVDDLGAQFARFERSLAEGNRAELDVEIDVLRDRLRMDGV